ncbi:MAG: imidazoleglycerol-phosphate dehydratase (hisB) [Candidatus Bathyarchaeota archaeon B26-1]|nr:MAG: imidazoleglycerol-phosphate dehydratase (hisB) [Candidatus Bathyarchaeota archaeon B26-1]
MRIAEVSRKTKETDIYVKVNLDGSGRAEVEMDAAFCAHMVTSLAAHSLIDLKVKAKGDLKHHVTEDVAICLGKAIREALGDSSGIRRFGYATVPMDCSLASAAVDLSGRPYSRIDLKVSGEAIEDMPREDIYHFLETLATSLKANIHLWVHYGVNDHHKVEAAFKALALSLRQAVSKDPRRMGVPSSKGVI